MSVQDAAVAAQAGTDRAEFERRLAAVRELMSAEGFDLLIAADNDSWLLPGGHVRYLSNFTVGNLAGMAEYSAAIVPLQGEPVLVIPPGPRVCFEAWAEATAWIANVRTTPPTGWPPAHNLFDDVVAVVRENAGGGSRIGMCGTFPGANGLVAELSDMDVAAAAVVDARGVARDIVERAREVKSPWEVVRLREAQAYAEESVKTFMDAVEPGRKQIRAVAEGEWRAKELGADEAMIIMSSGTAPWVWWIYQGERRFSAGDLVSMEGNARVGGYISQLARSGVIGDATPVQQAVVGTATAALEAMIARVAPGATGGDLWDAAVEVVNEAKLATWGRFGHGMGLSMAESFDVMPGDDRPLREGHCIELHAGVIHQESEQSALIGDQYLVQNGKAVPLSEAVLPFDLAPAFPTG